MKVNLFSRRGGLSVLVLALLAGILLISCSSAAREIGGSVPAGNDASSSGNLASAPRPGHPAPEFTVQDINGKAISLSDFRGRPVLINFWTTWCPPCRAEMPDIEKVYQKYKDKSLVVLGISVGEDRETVAKYLEKGGFSWIFLVDQIGETFTMRYRGAAFPSSFFVDKDGIIQDVSIGALNEKGLETKLEKILPAGS